MSDPGRELGEAMTARADEIGLSVCALCSAHYIELEGWLGYCAACVAVADDHDSGMHHSVEIIDCRFCGRVASG